MFFSGSTTRLCGTATVSRAALWCLSLAERLAAAVASALLFLFLPMIERLSRPYHDVTECETRLVPGIQRRVQVSAKKVGQEQVLEHLRRLS